MQPNKNICTILNNRIVVIIEVFSSWKLVSDFIKLVSMSIIQSNQLILNITQEMLTKYTNWVNLDLCIVYLPLLIKFIFILYLASNAVFP